jgi:CRISPR-associated endoribonuclease Cas6
MSGLYSTIIRLKPESDAVISPTQGYYTLALFLNLMRTSNPELAEKLHDSSTFKPFTISPLLGSFKSQDKNLKIASNCSYSVRLTFLNEETFCHFLDATLKTNGIPLRIESAIFLLDSVLVNRSESPLCDYQSYEELMGNALPERKISLRFDSITTFRSGGNRNVIFPQPNLILGSYFQKWQHFSPIRFSSDLANCWQSVRISRYKLESHILHFKNYQETGFAGECILEVDPRLSDEAVKAINTLANFAFFCGTGAKTTMGMGQTRRIYEH